MPCSSEKYGWESGSSCNSFLILESRGSAVTCSMTNWASTIVKKVMGESSIGGETRDNASVTLFSSWVDSVS